MEDRVKKYLKDILDSIVNIDIHLQHKKDFNLFSQNITIRKAVERDLEIIGEAVSKLLKINSEISITYSRVIVDLRNKIIHSYDTINETIIWKIILKDIPVLKVEVEKLLKEN